MENIKLRAWDNQLNKFHYFNNYNDTIFFDIVKTKKLKIDRFIGIKSCGRDIYENDIIAQIHKETIPIERDEVRYNSHTGEPIIMPIKVGYEKIDGISIYLVVYELWGCKFHGKFLQNKPESIGQHYGFGDLFIHYDNKHHKMNLKIIGNIYENADLMQ